MRELEIVPGADESGALVVRIVGDADGERLLLRITKEVRRAIGDGGDMSDDAGAPAAADDDATADTPVRPRFTALQGGAGEENRQRMTPRQIQERIRSGASIGDIVAATGMHRKEVEPFAWPVIGERRRITDLARASSPQRSDGPAPLTLEEILATAFAARDLDLAEARWDARRDQTGQWIIALRWSVGTTDNLAEWSFHADGGAATTVARNEAAAELVDPDFARTRSPFAVRQAGMAEPEEDDEEVPEEFLRHPDDVDEGPRRRRKTVMPSWEDVLLGVRPTGQK